MAEEVPYENGSERGVGALRLFFEDMTDMSTAGSVVFGAFEGFPCFLSRRRAC